jgi:hypothetical protein
MVKLVARFVRPLVPKRRWAQFSIGTMLIVVTSVCIGLVFIKERADRRERQRMAVTKFDEAGDGFRLGRAMVVYDYQRPKVQPLGPDVANGRFQSREFQPRDAKTEPPGPKWMRRFLGDDYFCRVIGLEYQSDPWDDVPAEAMVRLLGALPTLEWLTIKRSDATDEDLRQIPMLPHLDELDLIEGRVVGSGLIPLERFPRLRTLRLRGGLVGDEACSAARQSATLVELDLACTYVGNAGVAKLTGMRNLEVLYLDGTRVTDVGLKFLATLPKLRSLSLIGDRVTDAGLIELRGYINLRSLNVSDTETTQAAISELRQALPNCKIVR